MEISKELFGVQNDRKILIVDDHPLYGEALASVLHLTMNKCDIRKTQTLGETLAILEEGFAPDMILFDLKLPDVTGISGFQKLRDRAPGARVLVISSLASSELVQSLLTQGAAGFLSKDAPPQTLRFAVEEVLSGKTYVPAEYNPSNFNEDDAPCAFQSNPELSTLTGQQIRILKLICAGKPNKQIAYELSLAEATVKAHITALLRRLGVHNRTQAVVVAETALMRYGNGEPEARAFLEH